MKLQCVCSFTILVFALVFLSCSSDNQVSIKNNSGKKLYELKKVGNVKFPVSNSSPELSDIFCHNHDGYSLVAILNKYELNVDLLRYNGDVEIEGVFKLEHEGPNGLKAVDGYIAAFFKCPEHTLLFWNNATGKIIEFALNGHKLGSYDIDNFPPGVRPIISPSTPLVCFEDRYILSLWLENPSSPNFAQEPAVAECVFNSVTNQLTLTKIIFNYPEVYESGFWSFAPFKYTPSICKMDSVSILVSFPVDKNVYHFDVERNKLLSTVEVIHPRAKDFKSMNDFDFVSDLFKGRVEKPSFEENAQYALTNPDYLAVSKVGESVFNVRIANVRPDVSAYKIGNSSPKYGVVIFDSEFKILGDTLFSQEDYYFDMMFNTQHGLHVFNMKETNELEGFISFDIFEVSPNSDTKSKGSCGVFSSDTSLSSNMPDTK